MRAVRQAIRARRRSEPFATIARACEKYLRAWYNDDFYDFTRNGEAFALRRFARWRGSAGYCVWDVGAHEGEWADQARALLGDVQVVSFELIKPIADRMIARADPGWHRIVAVGLSDEEGEIEVDWNHDHDTTNSIRPREESTLFQGAHRETVGATLRTADRLIAEGLPAPVLLKIDVEGAEAAVLRGASALIGGAEAPAMIQFEYGQTWIPFGETLRPTWERLRKAGYAVGRLFPDHVEFKDYDYSEEHFRMGNYIAVRDPALKALLANAGR